MPKFSNVEKCRKYYKNYENVLKILQKHDKMSALKCIYFLNNYYKREDFVCEN